MRTIDVDDNNYAVNIQNINSRIYKVAFQNYYSINYILNHILYYTYIHILIYQNKPYRIILLCLSDNTHLTYNMPKSTKQERKEELAILNAMGIERTYIYRPEYHKTECSICLKKIHKGEQKTLECNHMFHGECLRRWATRTTPSGKMDGIRPIKNRRIHLFKKGENIFSCPCCRVEYTHDFYSNEIKQVLPKIM